MACPVTTIEILGTFGGTNSSSPTRVRAFQVNAGPDQALAPDVADPLILPAFGDKYPQGDPVTNALVVDDISAAQLPNVPGWSLVLVTYRRVSWMGAVFETIDSSGFSSITVQNTSTSSEPLVIPRVYSRTLTSTPDGDLIEYLPLNVTVLRPTARFTLSLTIEGTANDVMARAACHQGKIHTDLRTLRNPVDPTLVTSPALLISPQIDWRFDGAQADEVGFSPNDPGAGNTRKRLVHVSYTWSIQRDNNTFTPDIPGSDTTLAVQRVPLIEPFTTVSLFRRSVPFASGAIEEVPLYVVNEKLETAAVADPTSGLLGINAATPLLVCP